MVQFMDVPFSMFNNQDPEDRPKRKAKTVVVKIANTLNSSKSSQGKPKETQGCHFKCEKTENWIHNCAKPLPGPCSKCKAADVPDSGQCRSDCPTPRKRLDQPEPLFPALTTEEAPGNLQ